jgi:hypothetical protein
MKKTIRSDDSPKILSSRDLCSACRQFIWEGNSVPLGETLDRGNFRLLAPEAAITFNMHYGGAAAALKDRGPRGQNCDCINKLLKARSDYNAWIEQQ